MGKKVSHYVGLAILSAWILSSLVLGAAMMALHAPLADPNLSAFSARNPVDINTSIGTEPLQGMSANGLSAVHFISEKCGCSAAVAKHLLERGRLASLE